MLHIKVAILKDIDLIRELTFLVWPQTYTPILGPVQVQYMLDKFYHPDVIAQQMQHGQTFIICYYNDIPAAFAAFEAIEPGLFKLHKIYILPGHQGKGIGKFMMQYITSTISGYGATRLRLNVNRYNKSAIGFYEKIGFKNLGDEDINIGGGYFMNDHILELPLPYADK